MNEQLNIQWFPGHMVKARRMITENSRLCDAVCEVIDARIPYSSRNPEVPQLVGDKPRLIIMNRVDQADPTVTAKWREYFKSAGFYVMETDAKSGKGTSSFQNTIRGILKDKIKYYSDRGQTGRLLRVMILGIPNVGKSSFINRVAKRRAAEASDRPGVTRGKQWINLGSGIEMMDTPGLLWPKFEDKLVGEHLAFTGAVRDEILDTETLGAHLIKTLVQLYPNAVEARYKISLDSEDGFELLSRAARKRGFLISGGELDLERMSNVLLDEFRVGKLGRLTLEVPPEE